MRPFQFRIGARWGRPSTLTRNKSCSCSTRRFRSLALRRPREAISRSARPPVRGRSLRAKLRDDLLSFDTTLLTSRPGLPAGRTLKKKMFRMNKQLKYIIVFLFMVTLAAAQTAIADPVTVELAEGTPPADPGGLIPPTTTTTTTTTTSTLPTIPRCPDGLAGATAGSKSGYNYWSFDDSGLCNPDPSWAGSLTLFCFENPQVDLTRSDMVDWESITPDGEYYSLGWVGDFNGDGESDVLLDHYTKSPTIMLLPSTDGFGALAAIVTGAQADYQGTIQVHPEACYICGCYRGRLLRARREDHDGGRLAPKDRRRARR